MKIEVKHPNSIGTSPRYVYMNQMIVNGGCESELRGVTIEIELRSSIPENPLYRKNPLTSVPVYFWPEMYGNRKYKKVSVQVIWWGDYSV